MADKKNEFDDINQLLSGISDDLISPSKGEKSLTETTPEQGTPTTPPAIDNSNEKQIMDLLSGLDDSDTFSNNTSFGPETPSMDEPSSENHREVIEPSQINEPEQVPPEPSEPEPASDDIFANMPGLDPEPSQPTEEIQTPEVAPEEPAPYEIPEPMEEAPSPSLPTEPDFTVPDAPIDEAPHTESSSPLEGLEDLLEPSTPIDDGVTSEESVALMAPEKEEAAQQEKQEEPKPIENMNDLDIPDFDLSLPGEEPAIKDKSPSSSSSIPELDDLPGMDEIGLPKEDVPAEKPKAKMPFFGGKTKQEKVVTEKPIEKQKPEKQEKAGLKLSDKQLNFIYKRISHFGPQLKETTVNVVQKELLPISEINTLLSIILHRKTVKQIKEFLEKKLKTKISGPLLDPNYQKQLLDKEEERHPRKERITRERAARAPRAKPSYVEDFENNVLPVLKPLIIVVSILAVAAILLYPPVWSHILISKGVSLIESRDVEKIDKAEINFDEALKIRNKYHEAFLKYGRAYLSIDAYSRAQSKFLSYKEFKGADFDFNLGMGDLRLAQEQFKEALLFFENASQQKKDSFEAQDGMGRSYFAMEDLQKSRHVYEQYLKKNPKNVTAQYRILRVFIKQDNLEEIENKYEEILLMKSKKIDPLVVTELGRYYINKAKIEPKTRAISKRLDFMGKATTVLKSVTSKHQKYAPGFFQLSRLRYEKNELFLAEQAIEHALKLDSTKAEYHDLLGRVYLKRKVYDKAYANFENAVQKNSDYIVAHYNIANLNFYHASNDLKALDSYQVVKSLIPESKEDDLSDIDINEVNYNIGYLKHHLNDDYMGTLESLAEFGKSFPDKPAYLILTADTYYKMGQYALARKHYEAAVGALTSIIAEGKSINPRKERDRAIHKTLSSVYNNLGMTWYQLGNNEIALKYLWSAVESIKTIGFFNENEAANVNLNLILHPPYKSLEGHLLFDNNIPRYYDFPD